MQAEAITTTRADDFRSMVAMVRRRRSLLFTVFVAVFAVVFVVGLLLPPKYSSSMKILVRSAPTDMVSTPQRADGVTLGTVSEAEVNSEVEFLTSYDLLREAVVKNHLAHDGLLSRGNEQENIDRAVRKLGKALVVTPVRKANIIEVEYADRTPALAAAVLRSIESGYLEAHLRAQSTPGGYGFFKAQTGHYQDELTRSQAALAGFSRQQNIVNLDQQRSLLTGTLTERESSLQQCDATVAQLKQEIVQSELLQARLAPRQETLSRSGVNQYSVDHLTALLAELNNRRAQQQSKFRDDDPFLKETDAEIAATQSALAKARTTEEFERATDVNPALQSVQTALATKRVDLAGWVAKQAVLRQQIRSDTEMLNHLSDVSGQYDLLTSQVQQARENFVDYGRRREQARVSDILDQSKITNVVVAQEPTESQIPSQSRLLLNLMLGLVLAAFASIAVVLASEYVLPALRESAA